MDSPIDLAALSAALAPLAPVAEVWAGLDPHPERRDRFRYLEVRVLTAGEPTCAQVRAIAEAAGAVAGEGVVLAIGPAAVLGPMPHHLVRLGPVDAPALATRAPDPPVTPTQLALFGGPDVR